MTIIWLIFDFFIILPGIGQETTSLLREINCKIALFENVCLQTLLNHKNRHY
jgi:hypothetical protein